MTGLSPKQVFSKIKKGEILLLDDIEGNAENFD